LAIMLILGTLALLFATVFTLPDLPIVVAAV
jgi:hypothetical protein